MTAAGVLVACAAGGAGAGAVLDLLAVRVRRERPRAAEAASVAAVVVADAGEPQAGEPQAGVPGPSARPVPGPSARRSAAVVERSAAVIVTGGLFALAAVRLGAVPALAAYCVLFGGLVAVSITDLRVGLVPRAFLYPSLALMAAGLVGASAAGGGWRPLLDSAIGGAVAFLLFAVVWWVYPGGMGFGDVRLAGLCGAGLGWLGLPQLYLGFLAAFVVGSVAGIGLALARGTGRKTRLAFGPALAAGTAFGVLWGGWLGNLWLHPG